MIKMFNIVINLFSKSNTEQTNITSINPKIDTTIQIIKKNFFDGSFKEAIDNLNSLIEENSAETLKSIKYQLLILKADFFLNLRKIEEFKKLLLHIETEYQSELQQDNNIKFKELKLTLLSLEKHKNFFDFANKLILETPNSKPIEHLEIMYYLNNGDIKKAKEIFDKEIKNTKYRNKLLLMGGHIYSKLYEISNYNKDFFDIADNYYREALEVENLSFLEKLQIQGFYTSYLLNNNFNGKISKKDLIFSVKDYKNSLETVLKAEEYFDENYINIIIENYIYTLAYLGLEEEYKKLYEGKKDKLSIKHYIQYCGVKNIPLNHEFIQKEILQNNSINDLLTYTSLIFNSSNENIEKIVNFLQKNNNFLYKYGFILYSYIKGKILLNLQIEENIKRYLKENKSNDINILLAYIEQVYSEKKQIDNDDIKHLIELAKNENNFKFIILDVIEILKKINKRKEYLDIALSKQNIFSSIIFETLKICFEDENLILKEFEYFLQKIENKDIYPTIIGNIYAKYNKYDKSFEYYCIEFKKNPKLEISLVLLQCVLNHYYNTKEILNNHEKVFNFILTKSEELSLEQLFFLLEYSIRILEDTKQITFIINKKLLKLDIKNLDNNIKIILSNFYIGTRFNEQVFKLFLHNQNECLYDGSKKYISNKYEILKDNINNFGFVVIDEDEYFVKSNDEKNYHKESLIHKICEPYAYIEDNPNVMMIDVPDGILEFIEKDKNNKKDLFEKYSNGTHSIGLYTLSQNSYKNYFTLIPYLLNNDKITFNSLPINCLQKNVRKILTFSSILLLDEIGYLDKILERDDIVIPKSLTNWLKKYLEEINNSNMPIDISYIDYDKPKFIPYTHEKEKEAQEFKEKVSKLLIKLLGCNKIDDTSEHLPIKEAFQHLAPDIGEQEYYALSYCVNHNYQIISENNIFSMLFNKMKINNNFISNSICLLNDILSYEEYRSLILQLNNKNYQYLLNNNYLKDLISFMYLYEIKKLHQEEKELIRIANKYKLLNPILQYYKNKFEVLYPKRVVPYKTFFDKNIEELLKIIGNKDKNATVK